MRWGSTSRPPLATTAATRAICRGVTSTPPCPMEMETVSLGYHFSFETFRFQSGSGMSPLASAGRSTPVGAEKPRRRAQCEMRSIPSFTPTL